MTTNFNTKMIPQSVKEEAAGWVLDIHDDPELISSTAFVRWLYTSPAHLKAFEATAKTFELPVAIPQCEDAPKKNQRQPLFVKTEAGRQPWMAVAASLFVCSVILTVMFPTQSASPIQVYHTQKGEVTSHSLPDNSILYLDTNTSADVTFNSLARRVRLVHGRVLADVTHDPNRKFSVSLDDATAFTALGTAYSVEKSEASWTLKVYEGVVGVESSMVHHKPVKAGWGLTYSRHQLLSFSLPDTLKPGLPDWQHQQVQFRHTRLDDAVEQMNRYASKPLLLHSSSLASVKVSGVFSLQDTRQFAESVARISDARIEETPKNILLTIPD